MRPDSEKCTGCGGAVRAIASANQGGQDLAFESDAALPRGEEAADRPRDGGFAAAGFTDQRKGLALLDRKGKILHDIEHDPAKIAASFLLAP